MSVVTSVILGQSSGQQPIPKFLDDRSLFELHLSVHQLSVDLTNVVHFDAHDSAAIAAQDHCVLIDDTQRGRCQMSAHGGYDVLGGCEPVQRSLSEN